ncbi:MAG: S8 family serine peptidase [Candidatus Thermoplasmatota archaeon]|nr:S8 family serine peptidase [Candidatus Thermoplasmatota archaeon]
MDSEENEMDYAVVNTTDTEFLQEHGLDVVESYGSFLLIKGAPNRLNAMEDSSIKIKERYSLDKIRLKRKTIEVGKPGSLSIEDQKDNDYYLVKTLGPVKEEWRNKIEEKVKICDYVPKDTYIVKAREEAIMDLHHKDFIWWMGTFKPQYRISPDLTEIEGSTSVNVLTYEDPVRISRKIEDFGEVLNVGKEIIKANVESSYVKDIASINGVAWIEPTMDMHLMNAEAQWTVQSASSGQRSIWDQGLTGNGEVVGISDTGLDYDHAAFRDPEGDPIGSNHRKVVRYVAHADDHDLDSSGHGTHTSGSIAGNDGPFGSNDNDGMAKDAKLSFFDIGGSGDQLEIPSDYADIFNPAYNDSARIHSNSWGGQDSSYTSGAKSVDEYMWNHKDMLIFFAMGNSGDSSNTVGSPATAKNLVSVGASGNGQQSPSMNDMATFSSRGPTDDGRRKPTIVTPGDGTDDIKSADSDGDLSTDNSGYITMQGTSMACPVAAGSTALLRQYFVDGYYPGGSITPSASLMKAVLVNGAVEITGNGAYMNSQSYPNNDQGWGRVNLQNSLEFAGDSRNLRVFQEKNGISTGNTSTYSVNVEDTSEPLEITLTYTDYPGSTSASKALVNNLDLKITAPDSTVYKGNVFDGSNPGQSTTGGSYDDLNPVENFLRLNPQKGKYKIEVTGSDIPNGPQPFSIAVTGGLGALSNGTVNLDEDVYSGNDKAKITVVDGDLKNKSSLNVDIKSDTETTPESVTLSETSSGASEFKGSIDISKTDKSGVLQVSHGDTITATYYDQDTGDGTSLNKQITASVDAVAPTLKSSSPYDGKVGVSTNLSKIYFNFTEKVDPSTVNSSSVSISPFVNHSLEQGADSSKYKISIKGKGGGNYVEGSTGASAYGDYRDCQSFVPKASDSITKLSLYMKKEGSPPGDAVVEIIENPPDGTALGSTTIKPSEVGTSASWVSTKLSNPINVTKGTTYGIRVKQEGGQGDTSNRYRLMVSGDQYSDGQFYQYDGTSWSSFSSYDLSFKYSMGSLLQKDTWYNVTLNSNISDEAGNILGSDSKFKFYTGEALPTFDIELSASGDGWNFISSKLVPTDNQISAILENPENGISGNYDKVMWYDGKNDEWKSYNPNRADKFNDLSIFEIDRGYWIQMSQNDTLTVKGTYPSSTIITLDPGWNMVGYPADSNTTADSTLPQEVTKIGTFKGTKKYDVKYQTDLSKVTLTIGEGYWMYNSGNTSVEWTVKY